MKTYTYDALVIGTGAAGYNAACRLKQMNVHTAIVTEGINCGTSRNTGSDKQTYYKLSLGGSSSDSVYKMAQNLFNGGCVDGDNALCEAALSVRSFMHLCELGVPFPVNRYGEYVGYKTDHDPYERATSAGPLTSKYMTEALQKKAEQLGVEVYEGYLAIDILKHDDKVCGLVCMEKSSENPVCFRCNDIVMATGGPAGIYADSVYPMGHTGTTSLAIEAGAILQNLTEWQYGLASVKPRWNVSGTYMQVLPRFVSVDSDGTEYEFLEDFFTDKYEALSMVFLKGYQWPFDSKKVMKGSSLIDLLVYRECVLKGRKVFLDFTKNPFGMEDIDFSYLSPEACEYLKSAGACFGKPIDRLRKMNSPAIDLYFDKGVDISQQYLEIALCAQHNNGGIAVDKWWQTSVRGLFAVGECAGTHGITRPGGSALNAGQVGSLRASQYIAQYPNSGTDDESFDNLLVQYEKTYQKVLAKIISKSDNISDIISKAQRAMSSNASAIRRPDNIKKTLAECIQNLDSLCEIAQISDASRLCMYYKLKDILTTQASVLTAMLNYSEKVTGTRGSSLCFDKNGSLREGLEEIFRFSEEDGKSRSMIQEVVLKDGVFECNWRSVRPIPDGDNFFENVWAHYRQNKNIF